MPAAIRAPDRHALFTHILSGISYKFCQVLSPHIMSGKSPYIISVNPHTFCQVIPTHFLKFFPNILSGSSHTHSVRFRPHIMSCFSVHILRTFPYTYHTLPNHTRHFLTGNQVVFGQQLRPRLGLSCRILFTNYSSHTLLY